jgi:hypothetical protein
MPQRLWSLLAVGLLAVTVAAGATTVEKQASKLAPLIDPVKLATLRERGANPRIQKAVAILADAEAAKLNPHAVCALATKNVKMQEMAAALTKAALLRNLDIARKLGCLTADGLADMRRGKSPTVMKGPYKGDKLSVDHIIPFSVCPELDRVIANLELMPLRMNLQKKDKVGDRQRDMAKKFHQAGLLSKAGLDQVLSAPQR